MSYFSDAIAAGLEDITAAAGEAGTLWRGDVSVPVSAVPGDGVRRGQPAEVIRLNSMRDWLILVADYDFGSGPVVPEREDQIKVAGVTYEVLPGDNGDVYSAPSFAQYRVHTKVISIG